MKIKGIIFDCDGVLVDSEPFSCGAWNVLMKETYNIIINSNYDKILGKNSQDAARYYLEMYQIPYSQEILDHLAILKEETYYRISKDHLHPVNGIKTFIEKMLQQGIQIIVASSGTLEKIKYSLSETNLLKYFSNIVSADDVSQAKPSPDIFLKSMAKLNLAPSECIIIEDSVTGVEAGKASGAYTIAITTTYDADKLKNADLIINNFENLNIEEI